MFGLKCVLVFCLSFFFLVRIFCVCNYDVAYWEKSYFRKIFPEVDISLASDIFIH